MLQEVAERLLNASEHRAQTLTRHQQECLDEAVEDIGALITHLNRRGRIVINGPLQDAVQDLHALDNQLIMLLEQVWHMAHTVIRPECGSENISVCDATPIPEQAREGAGATGTATRTTVFPTTYPAAQEYAWVRRRTRM